MRSAYFALALALALALGSGCVTQGPVQLESDLLPRPGARIELLEVTNESRQAFAVDAVALLRAAMSEALIAENLSWTPDSQGPDRFGLSLSITEYRPGDAFKRWLIPGWGGTVLAVAGTLRDAQTQEVAATVVHKRSVYIGGAYSIGAWREVFGWVAQDLTADLQRRIERGGDFVVSVTPRADQPAASQPRATSPAVRVASVTDARTERQRIGERQAAFGVSMGDVYLSRRVPEVMREVLTDDLWAGGLRVVGSDEDAAIDLSVHRFWLGTDTTPLYWDVFGEIEIEVSVTIPGAAPRRSRLSCRQTERTWVWPTATLGGRVLDACLAELGTKLHADLLWLSSS